MGIIAGKKAGFHMDTLMHVKIAEIVGHQNFAQEGLSRQELDKVNPVIRGGLERGNTDTGFYNSVNSSKVDFTTN